MIELRDYQHDLLERVQKALGPPNARVMMQLPTGGGKTVIAAHLLADYLTGRRKAVWLTHRKELVTQTIERLAGTNGVRAVHERRWAVGIPAPTTAGGVMVLMAQTVGRRADETGVWSQYGEQDLMVIDEAHHATAKGWALAMKRWPGRIVGMTATPWRLSKKEGFDRLFNELICGPQVVELQMDNLLLNGELLRDVFFAAYPLRTDDVLDRLKALVEETEAAESKTVTAESSNEPSRLGNGEIST